MAQTARDTIKRAMRMLGVIVAGVEPTAVEAANGLLALNGMMHGWKGQGVDVGHIDLGLNDDLALDEMHHNGVTAMLAAELSPEFQVPVPIAVAAIAASGFSALQAAYIANSPSNDLISEIGLRRMSANRRFLRPI
ncbi:MAG TPA: hypothetical protein VN579_07555 [Bryobacteraceae bacterium]|nr:hypothetical protein [Bryobacteraceae bacterium]